MQASPIPWSAKPRAAARSYKEMGTLFSLSKSATSFDLGVSEIALLLFGVLLVVGLIGEYAKSDKWKKHLKIFEMCVIIGVAGELLADGGIFLFSSHLQMIADAEIVELTKEAGDARTSAKGAAAAARFAKEQSDKAVASATSALSLARDARKEADSFKKAIVSAKEAAARAESKLADRVLTDEQVQSIAKKLKIFGGQTYTVTAYWESKESLGIANRIHASLHLAGWSYSPEGSKSMMLGGVIGVFVYRHPDADESTKQAADSLVSALNVEGIEAALRLQNPTNNPKHNTINFSVGSKR